MGKSETLPRIWEIPDGLWEQIQPVILKMDAPKSTGRKRANPRRILDCIIFRMRAGCQWNHPTRKSGGRQHHPQNLPALGGVGPAGTYLGCVGRGA